MEPLDDLIGLARAAELSGLSHKTLQVLASRGRLRTVQPARDKLTTRRWLDAYLRSRTTRPELAKPLPTSYVAPCDEESEDR